MIDDLLYRKADHILPAHTSQQHLAEKFSTHFVTNIANIRQNIGHSEDRAMFVRESCQPSGLHLTKFPPTSEEEVRRFIMNSPASTCSQDQNPSWLIKEHVSVWLPFSTKLANKSLIEDTFPDNLKHSVIRPLLTSKDKEDLASYRPVANLKYLGKLIERIAGSFINDFVTEQSLQDPRQSAYMKNHSVETAVVHLCSDVLVAMDEGNITAVVLLNLSSAFDTVDHDIMVQQFSHLRITGTVLDWCKSYLTGRTQAVCVGSASLGSVAMPYSVPHGSVLGPQMFSLYVLPICEIITKHDLQYDLYADDIQLYASCSPHQAELDSLCARLENCISEIKEWMKRNFLKLNKAKTEFIVLGSEKQRLKVTLPYLKVGDVRIPPADKVRSLGLLLDANMIIVPQGSTV